MTGNSERDSLRIPRIRYAGAKWAICSQVAWEQVKGSEIRSWSPNATIVMDGKDPRVRGILFLEDDDMIRTVVKATES